MEKSESITRTFHPILDNIHTSQIFDEDVRRSPYFEALENFVEDPNADNIDTCPDKADENENEDLKNINVQSFNAPELRQSSSLEYLKNYSINLQSWKGNIIDFDSDKGIFSAELTDLINSGTKEIAEFEYRFISPDDRKLIEMGASFYWSIVVEMNKGQIFQKSEIRFQRLKWEQEDFDNAADRASDLFDFFNV